jgi:putative addiction module killer protein
MVSKHRMTLTVREYLDERGRSPFREWLNSLGRLVRARVQARILRFETGNLGDHKQLGAGVWEARLDFGPGYRVYFGKQGTELVLLLVGGDKDSQNRDVSRAKECWASYVRR